MSIHINSIYKVRRGLTQLAKKWHQITLKRLTIFKLSKVTQLEKLTEIACLFLGIFSIFLKEERSLQKKKGMSSFSSKEVFCFRF